MTEPITIDQQIECAERELKLRLRVYPNRVMNGKMTAQLMARETTRMEAVIGTLKAVKEWAVNMATSIENGAEPYESSRRLIGVAPLVPPGGLF